MLKTNIPTVSNRPNTPCPADSTVGHCNCSANQHACHRCGKTW